MRAFVLVGPYLFLCTALIAPAAAQDAATQIVVTTDPSGANVFVDGRLAGAAPVTVTGLLPGEHLVTARVEDGRHVERRITVDAGRASVIELAFDPLPIAPAPAPPPPIVQAPPPEAEVPPPPVAATTASPTTEQIDRTPVAASLGVLPSTVPGWNGATSDPRIGFGIGGGIAVGVGLIAIFIGAAIGIDIDHNVPGFVTFVTGLGIATVGAGFLYGALVAAPMRGPSTESGVRLGAIDLMPVLSLSPTGGSAGVVLRW